jgi:pimeloyl-ACP methyl ester carboxylesterase
MKILFGILVFGYLAICILFYIFQRSFLYFPQPASYANAITTTFNNNGQKLTGWVINPGQKQLLLYYGGNASAIENNIEFFNQVAPQHTVYLIPYRGYGNNQGSPTEEALYSDALHIYERLKDNYESVTLMGRSLGSGVATFVAANRKVDKLVLSTPYDSIQNIAKTHYPFLPVSLLTRDKYLSAERAGKITAETLILIAEKDKIIVRERSEALVSQFDSNLLTKVIVLGADHNNISLHTEYIKSVQEFLKTE